jgi:sRNA-binding protein
LNCIIEGVASVSKRQHLPDPAIGATLELLAEQFPKCFSVFEGRRRPLKIGIHHDVLAALDGAVTPQELGRALRVYVVNRVYLSRLVAGAVRIDLAGEPAGIVTPEQVPPPRPRPARKAAAPVKSPVKGCSKSLPELAVVAAATPGPQRLGLADLRAAAKRRRESA